jgi:hypothetical protein
LYLAGCAAIGEIEGPLHCRKFAIDGRILGALLLPVINVLVESVGADVHCPQMA